MNKTRIALLCLVKISIAFSITVLAQENEMVLFKDVNVFDGESNTLLENLDVLVEGNLIKTIGKNISVGDAKTIDGKGRTLMPGLTDAHTHLSMTDRPEIAIYKNHWGYNGALATVAARNMLLRGFTTVRDLGGPVAGLKKAIDEGVVPGPRILPSGPMISQTSGHGDFLITDQFISGYFNNMPSKAAIFGWGNLADGITEVQKAAREALRTGAAQLKVMAGGGVSSHYDPLDTTQYTLAELEAAVTEAEHWGTYVAVHAFTDKAANLSIDAGVKSIDHGPFLTEKTLKRMVENGVWLSPQAFLFNMTPEQLNIVGTPIEPKMRKVNRGSANVLKWAKKHQVNIAWGTDLYGPFPNQALQNQEFLARRQYFTSLEILKQATSGNARLFELSGLRHPYREGRLGVIKPGAYADILLIDGNPIEDIALLAEPEENIHLIMKDGQIYKNSL